MLGPLQAHETHEGPHLLPSFLHHMVMEINLICKVLQLVEDFS